MEHAQMGKGEVGRPWRDQEQGQEQEPEPEQEQEQEKEQQETGSLDKEVVLEEDFIGFDSENDEDRVREQNVPTPSKTAPALTSRDAKPGKRPALIGSVLRWDVPWMRRDISKYSRQPMELLHQEIVDFANYVSPTEEERFARSEALRRLEAVVKGVWPEAVVQPFGSFDSQLFLPSSDLDVVVMHEGLTVGEHAKPPLGKLAKALLKASLPLPETLRLITKARVPIIKYVDAQTDFELDVSFNVTSGLEAAAFMRQQMALQPAVRPLTLVLKHFLDMRSLNEVFSGGLGSYAVMCLVISFLQMHPLAQSGLIRPHENLGVLLMEFFELYGRHFNSEVVGISVLQGGAYISKEDWGWVQEAKPHLLSIVDPQNTENDISKGSFAYGAVRQSFEHAFNVLKCAMAELETHQRRGKPGSSKASILGSIITLDPKLLRHRYYIQQTANL